MTDQKSNSLKEDKDQALFKKACEKILGRDWFYSVSVEAREAYKAAVASCQCETKNMNAGIRAGNLVLLQAIQEAGVSNWRKFMEEQSGKGFNRQEYQPPPQPAKPQPKQPRRDGSALDNMINQAINKRKEQ